MPDGRCHACGKPVAGGRPEFRALCPTCSAFLHCCLNCGHYDPAVHHACRASATAEFQPDKKAGNFCEEFVWAPPPAAGGGTKSRAEIEKMFPGSS